MKIEIKDIAEFLAKYKIEYPYCSDWPENENDAAVMWEIILERYFKKRSD